MAKGNREIVALVCAKCKSQNYVTTRNKVNMEKKLVLKKWCKACNAQREHKESTKLK
jgi:large subunit ribosomal protein L33